MFSASPRAQSQSQSQTPKAKSFVELRDQIAIKNKPLQDRIQALAKTHADLEQTIKPVEYYYSDDKLHAAAVTKSEDSKALLKRLEDEKVRLSKLVETNKQRWESICKNYADMLEKKSKEVSQAKSDLLSGFARYHDKWKEKKSNYDKAKEKLDRFNQAKAKFDSAANWSILSTVTLSDRLKTYKKINDDFGDIVKLDNFNGKKGVYESCTPIGELKLPAAPDESLQIPSVKEVGDCSKTIEELKQIAAKTTDAELIKQATKLEELKKRSDEPLPDISKFKSDDDEKTSGWLMKAATTMSATFTRAKVGLLAESKERFKELEDQVPPLFKSLKTERLALNANRQTFAQISSKVPRDKIKPYEELQSQFKKASVTYKNSFAESKKIMDNYQKFREDFGVAPRQDWEEATKGNIERCAKDLKDELKDSQAVMLKSCGEMAKIKKIAAATAAASQLLRCFRYMIETKKAIGYWRAQVFHSGYDIYGTMVPHGIALMHQHLREKCFKPEDVWKTLRAIKDVAVTRKKASTGWFFTRTMTTTDMFYNIVENIVLEDLSAETVAALKVRFMNIPGLGENLVAQSNQPLGRLAK